jgi:hypothetical protein
LILFQEGVSCSFSKKRIKKLLFKWWWWWCGHCVRGGSADAAEGGDSKYQEVFASFFKKKILVKKTKNLCSEAEHVVE